MKLAFSRDLKGFLLIKNFANIFSQVEVENLIRQGSNQAPLHLTCISEVVHIIKPFRFLNFWCSHKNFKSIVERCWQVDFMSSLFLELHAKLKKVKNVLVKWSKQEHGNISLFKWLHWRM